MDAFWPFAPSPARGQALDQGMQQDLLGSLCHLAERAPETLAGPLAAPIASLRSGRPLGPEAFGLYYDMTEHLLAAEIAPALQAAHRLAACAPRTHREPWRVLGRGSVAAHSLDAILDRRLGDESADFRALPERDVQAFGALLEQGLALLADGAPALHAEITAITRDILLAQAPADAELTFDGASHYQFWGLLLLNPVHHPDRLAVAEVLAHESGHSVLFGLCREQTLSENADDERYPSPLRPDPRPMDGIIHATYVSARMAWAMCELARSGALTAQEEARARTLAIEDCRRFRAGLQTVKQHARLTPLGQEVLQGAQNWVDGSGVVEPMPGEPTVG